MQRAYKLTDQQCALNSRQKVIQTVQTMNIGQKNSVCVVSNVLQNGLHINNLIPRCRETWAGDGWHAWGGRGWGPAASTGLGCVFGARVMGVSVVIAAWGEGVMCACAPPLTLIRSLAVSQKARKMLAGA